MLSRAANTLRSSAGKRMLRPTQNLQRRNMAGHGHFMETNKTGERIGDFFGTVAWLWVFHRFRMDGMVLLGFEHPWEHGHADHGDDGGHGSIIPGSPQAKVKEATANWEKFSERATIPGDDDDDDDEDDDDDDE